MLSPRAIYGEIFSNDEAFRLFCSIAASGEAQGGWENGRIAALVPESFRDLAPKIARHGADEDKHGRIFYALLRKRKLPPAQVPADTDYTMRLEGMGIGLAHSKLRANRPLTEEDIIAYLAHSRVTEQRASEQMRSLRRYSDNADVSRAATVISADEDNHLAYCQEELLRLADEGHRRHIESVLRTTARAEIAVYRDVSKAVMAHLGRTLNWSRAKCVMLARGIDAVYLYERLGGWRRMVTLRMPARRDPLGTPASVRAREAAQSRERGGHQITRLRGRSWHPSARLAEVLYAPESELLVLRLKDRIMPATRDEYRREWAVAEKPAPSRPRSALVALATLLAIVTIILVAADTPPPAPPPSTAAPSKAPSTTAQPTQPPGALSAPPNWKLAFSTDFPGTTLDTSTWAECYPWTPKPPGCTNFGNADEREWYLPSQVHVGNGALALVAQRTPTEGSDPDGKPKSYTCRSGMVTTYPSVHLKYGFVQVVARLPFGKGLWPAIWLIPSDGSWPPEIDIVEHWDTQLTASATLHTGKQNHQQRGTVDFSDADQGWHTYTLYWTQSRISVYYDRQLALTTTTSIPQQAMYLLLDLADENNSPGSCSGTMYVKSVNIWEPS